MREASDCDLGAKFGRSLGLLTQEDARTTAAFKTAKYRKPLPLPPPLPPSLLLLFLFLPCNGKSENGPI